MNRLALLLLALLTLPARATVKFVNGGASGSNNGTSWANGWTNTSSIGWAGLAPGDTVCMAGGTYSGSITTAKAGTSGNPITLKRATASDSLCGSSTAGWNSAFDAQVIMPGITYAGFNFITLQGTVANGIKMIVPNISGDPSAVGVIAANDSIIIDNVEIAGPCGTTACNQNGDSRAIDMSVFISGNFALQSNWIIRNSNLHGQCTILITTKSSNLLIEHTRFADSADSTPGNPNCHPNVVEVQDATNLTFRYNEVTNWQVEGIMLCPNGACSQNVNMYGNLWHDPMGGSFPRVMEVQGPGASGPDLAYNNTFIAIPFSTFGTANSGSYSGGSAGLNNIYISSAGSGLPSNDFDACNGSTCGETHGQNIATSIFTNFAGKDYTLATNTAAGSTLSSPFNTDLNGTARGANGTWDRGHYQIPSSSTTWVVRPDGGTRYSVNVPTGQCNGKFDASYASTGGTGTNQNCAYKDFRYMWDDKSGVVGAGMWQPAGGDTVVIRGCTADPSQVNPSNPNCRIGWDGPTGATSGNWCNGIGGQDCKNPTITAGTSSAHTRILGGYAFDHPGAVVSDANKQQLFCGFALVRGCFNLQGTQFLDIAGIELTTHNKVTAGNPGAGGNCTFGGSPAFPFSCSNNQPFDDYAQNGFVTDNTTANVTFQDVNVHGFNASALWGPIGGLITMTRASANFNGFAGWNFADAVDTPNAAGSQIIASYVTMNGNGCYEQYPIVNTTWPARACYDTNSGGFGDAWSGQDTSLDVFTCDHCVMLYNTKDAFIGPHTQIGTLTVTNSFSAGNMGGQMKFGMTTNANVLLQNNLFVTNCYRQTEALPGAVQNFNQSTGLGGSYLTGFCRANDGIAFLTRANSTVHWYGNTIVAANPTVVDMNCGFVDSGGVHEETNCNTSPLIWKDTNILGYTDPIAGAQPGLWFFDAGAGGSLVLTASFNNYFGVRNITPDSCGTNNIACGDPQLQSEPAQAWPGSEAALDVFNAFGGSGNSFYPTGSNPLHGTMIAGLTADYYATVRPSPPAMGGVEPAGAPPVVATPTGSPVPGTYTSTQTVTVSTVTAGATICATVNGSTPTASPAGTCTNGTGGPFVISTTTTIKAIGTKSGDTDSGLFSGLYTITPPMPPPSNLSGTVKLSGTITFP